MTSDHLFSVEVLLDPYEYFAHLRRRDPIHLLEDGTWLVTRHADASRVLRSPCFEHWSIPGGDEPIRGCIDRRTDWLKMVARTEEPNIRRELSRLLCTTEIPCQSEDLELTRLVGDFARRLDAGETVDLISAICRPYTSYAAAAFMGLPESERAEFVTMLCSVQSDLVNRVSGAELNDPLAMSIFEDYLQDLLTADRYQVPESTLLRSLRGWKNALLLDDAILLHYAELFIVAASDNLSGFIGNAFLAMAEACKFEQFTIPKTLTLESINELLRYCPTIQFVRVRATQQLELESKAIARDDTVYVAIGGANRDPSVFERPDELLLNRVFNPHISFGRGTFSCIGATFARHRSLACLTSLAKIVQGTSLRVERAHINTAPPVMRRVTELSVSRSDRDPTEPTVNILEHWRARRRRLQW